MSTISDYGWYYENGKIAIVVKDATSPDGWKAVDVSDRDVRIKATHYATPFTSNLDDTDKTYSLPGRFQHIIAMLAISRGYSVPPHNDQQQAAHFYRQYAALLKSMKKVVRSKGRHNTVLVGHYY